MIIPDELDHSGPLYLQVYKSIRRGVLSGRLRPGKRLPSSRDLALELQVSRNTVVQAYEQLRAEGYLEGRLGWGTFVAAFVPDELMAVHGEQGKRLKHAGASAETRISGYASRALEQAPVGVRPNEKLRVDFRYGAANVADFPSAEWRAITIKHLRKIDKTSLNYSEAGGYGPLREAIVDYVREHRGIHCNARDVIVVGGSQQALYLVGRALLDPGDRVLMENPTYPGARAVFQATGAKIHHSQVDNNGLDVQQVLRLPHRFKLAYTTPSHQFPTGGTMLLPRRLSFLQWAHDSGTYVLEDDYDSEYRFEGRPIEAIAALDTFGQVIYSGTFSKILAPSLRLGYLISPPALTEILLCVKSIADRHAPLLGQQVLATFLSSGQFERHMRRSRARNDSRRKALLQALHSAFGDRISVQGQNAGLHVTVWFRDLPASEIDSIVEKAASKGIGVYSIAPLYHGPPPSAGLLLGYSSLDEIEIAAGINALAQALGLGGRAGAWRTC